MKRPHLLGWRDVPGESRRYGLLVAAHGATLYAGRNVYRVRWWLS